MLRLFSSLFTLVFLAFAIAFAVANKAEVVLGLWPFETGFSVPVYLIGLGALFAGLVVGGVLSWAASLPCRFEARKLRKQLEKERAEIATRQAKEEEGPKTKFFGLFS